MCMFERLLLIISLYEILFSNFLRWYFCLWCSYVNSSLGIKIFIKCLSAFMLQKKLCFFSNLLIWEITFVYFSNVILALHSELGHDINTFGDGLLWGVLHLCSLVRLAFNFKKKFYFISLFLISSLYWPQKKVFGSLKSFKVGIILCSKFNKTLP